MINPFINILVVDDEHLFRQGLIALLSPHGIKTIGTADNGEQALKILKSIKPDVILLDLEMPVLNGSKTLDNIYQRYPHAKVIIVSSYHDEQLIKDNFNRGARAYVSKNEHIESLITAIRSVYKIGVYKENVPYLLKTKVVRDKHYYKLIFSPKEQEIIYCICEGKSVKQIGHELYISEKTVETHLTYIYKKSQVKNRAEFLLYAIKEGLQFLGRPKYLPKV
jgi:DNA-binding NarL/FixJ family response regulator